MKKQKIGIDIRAIGKKRTGDEYYTLNLIKEIFKIDKKNQYFLLTNTKETEELEKKIFLKNKPENVEIILVLPKFKLLWTFFALPKIAKKLNLDILHVQYIAPFWISKKIKLITTIADISFQVYPEFINKLDLLFLKLLIPLSLKRANKIIAVSDFTKNEIINYYHIKPSKISSIYNGEASKVFFSNKNKERILEKIGIKNPYLFYVGTHQPRKDIPTLIEAFLELKVKHFRKKEIKDLKLVIGGKTKAHNYDSRIDKKIKEAQNDSVKKDFIKDLIFTGYLNDEELVAVYRGAEIFVFPSLYEGFGLPLLEAMVSETPVVCSDIKCFREIAGNGARFYKPQNSISLQKVLLEILIKPQVKINMIKKGLKNTKRFSWAKTAQETLKVFLENNQKN